MCKGPHNAAQRGLQVLSPPLSAPLVRFPTLLECGALGFDGARSVLAFPRRLSSATQCLRDRALPSCSLLASPGFFAVARLGLFTRTRARAGLYFSMTLRRSRSRLSRYHRAMGNLDSEQCHKAAEECRTEAERAKSPIDRERWLRLAAQWMELKRRAEQKPR